MSTPINDARTNLINVTNNLRAAAGLPRNFSLPPSVINLDTKTALMETMKKVDYVLNPMVKQIFSCVSGSIIGYGVFNSVTNKGFLSDRVILNKIPPKILLSVTLISSVFFITIATNLSIPILATIYVQLHAYGLSSRGAINPDIPLNGEQSEYYFTSWFWTFVPANVKKDMLKNMSDLQKCQLQYLLPEKTSNQLFGEKKIDHKTLSDQDKILLYTNHKVWQCFTKDAQKEIVQSANPLTLYFLSISIDQEEFKNLKQELQFQMPSAPEIDNISDEKFLYNLPFKILIKLYVDEAKKDPHDISVILTLVSAVKDRLPLELKKPTFADDIRELRALSLINNYFYSVLLNLGISLAQAEFPISLVFNLLLNAWEKSFELEELLIILNTVKKDGYPLTDGSLIPTKQFEMKEPIINALKEKLFARVLSDAYLEESSKKPIEELFPLIQVFLAQNVPSDTLFRFIYNVALKTDQPSEFLKEFVRHFYVHKANPDLPGDFYQFILKNEVVQNKDLPTIWEALHLKFETKPTEEEFQIFGATSKTSRQIIDEKHKQLLVEMDPEKLSAAEDAKEQFQAMKSAYEKISSWFNKFDEPTDQEYKIFGATHETSFSIIKKKYYQLSREMHPDRNPNDSNALANFQAMGLAYEKCKDWYEKDLEVENELFGDQIRIFKNYIYEHREMLKAENLWGENTPAEIKLELLS